MYVIDERLARRLEGSEAAHWASLMEGLPRVYGAQVRRFGDVVALACPGMPQRSFVNRIFAVQTGEAMDEAIAWMRSVGAPVRVDACPLLVDELALRHLARDGYYALGFQVALFQGIVDEAKNVGAGAVEVRPATEEAEFDFATGALAEAFGETDPTWVSWLEDSMQSSFTRPDWHTYIAYVNGEMAGFGQLHIADGVGSLALAGTLERFRGRGVQTALIRHRIACAAAAGCDLIATQTGNGTVSQHNMERLGLRVAYSKAEFHDHLAD